MFKTILFILYSLTFTFSRLVAQEKIQNSYQVKTIDIPKKITPQVGGIDFFPDGRLAVCFMRGKVMSYDTHTKKWKLFADGLQEPLGILTVNDSEVLVMQVPELTRLTDLDGDGRADLFKNVTDKFGVSGNYHEFNYGPVMDPKGNLYIALNDASSGGGIRSIVRGQINRLGRDGQKGHREMFSVVPYRGWVLKITPNGKTIPFASGFRSPNGLGFDLNGNLLVTDNQGDWVPSGSLYIVKNGHFYGHPASLIWKDNWADSAVFNISVQRLNEMRTKPVVVFPQGIMANSPSQPTVDITKGKFGPFSGQIFIGEMNHRRLIRVMLEKIDGRWQGACVPFLAGRVNLGNNRLAFAPDGSLWVGQIGFGGWVGHSGIQKITYTGEVPMDVLSIHLTPVGFDLKFTLPVNKTIASNPNSYEIRRYRYNYEKKPLSEGVDVAKQIGTKYISVERIMISKDQKQVSLSLDNLEAGFIYEVQLKGFKSLNGKSISSNLICYTVNRLNDASIANNKSK